MLLTQFKQVQEIDKQIGDIHNQLRELYDERSKLFAEQSSLQNTTTSTLPAAGLTSIQTTNDDLQTEWITVQYVQLSAKWANRGIVIPRLKTLEPKLKTAYGVVNQLLNTKPELYDKMAVVLVPPSKQVKLSPTAKSSETHPLLSFSSELSGAKLLDKKADRSWRMVLVYAETEGLYLGTPAQLLQEKHYMVANYDGNALGVREYAAFVLQESKPVDETSWTVLLKNLPSDSNQVPSVKFNDHGYNFGLEMADSVFGDIRFRPAVEIN